MVPAPLPAWQESHVSWVASSMCLVCAPAMLGKADPVGPLGRPAGPEWQERQVPVPVAVAAGLALAWHWLHRGAALFGEVPVWAWQVAQSAANAAAVTVMWPLSLESVTPARKGMG